jgi:hypothetical protein
VGTTWKKKAHELLLKFLIWWKRCLNDPKTNGEVRVREDTFDWMSKGDWEPEQVIRRIKRYGLPPFEVEPWQRLFFQWKRAAFGKRAGPRQIKFPITNAKILRLAYPGKKSKYREKYYRLSVAERLKPINGWKNPSAAQIEAEIARDNAFEYDEEHAGRAIKQLQSDLILLSPQVRRQRAKAAAQSRWQPEVEPVKTKKMAAEKKKTKKRN